MICTEMVGENFIRTYSDDGYEILQIETGRIYGSALDKFPCKYTYEEIKNLRSDADSEILKKYEKIINIIEDGDAY